MKLRVIDFETTGKDPATCRPLECAAITYDTKTKERSNIFSTLIWTPLYEPIPADITELTGIDDELIQREGYLSPGGFLGAFTPDVKEVDYYCAYNVMYDMEVLLNICKKLQTTMPGPAEVFDAMVDLPWPENMQRCRQLQHRAFDLGLPMDGRRRHRALADVELICEIFDLYDMEAVLEYHKIPWVYYAAQIPAPWKDGGLGKAAAKEAGFGWEQAAGDTRKFPGKWVLRKKLGAELPEYSFSVEELK